MTTLENKPQRTFVRELQLELNYVGPELTVLIWREEWASRGCPTSRRYPGDPAKTITEASLKRIQRLSQTGALSLVGYFAHARTICLPPVMAVCFARGERMGAPVSLISGISGISGICGEERVV